MTLISGRDVLLVGELFDTSCPVYLRIPPVLQKVPCSACYHLYSFFLLLTARLSLSFALTHRDFAIP